MFGIFNNKSQSPLTPERKNTLLVIKAIREKKWRDVLSDPLAFDPEFTGGGKLTVLKMAIKRCDVELVRALLARGSDVGSTGSTKSGDLRDLAYATSSQMYGIITREQERRNFDFWEWRDGITQDYSEINPFFKPKAAPVTTQAPAPAPAPVKQEVQTATKEDVKVNRPRLRLPLLGKK